MFSKVRAPEDDDPCVLGFCPSRRRFRALVLSIPVVTFQHLITFLVRRGSLTRASIAQSNLMVSAARTRLMSTVIYKREREGYAKKDCIDVAGICSPRLCTVNNGGLSRSTPPFDLFHSCGMWNDRFAWRFFFFFYKIQSNMRREWDISDNKNWEEILFYIINFFSLSFASLQFNDYTYSKGVIRAC